MNKCTYLTYVREYLVELKLKRNEKNECLKFLKPAGISSARNLIIKHWNIVANRVVKQNR